MKKGKYVWVLEVIESYEDDYILEEFLSTFKEGEDIGEKEYFEFCGEFMDDMSELEYIKNNWEYIVSEGDESVFND